jgi:hypothetical protein
LVQNNEKGACFLTKVPGLGEAHATVCDDEALSSHFGDGSRRLEGMEQAETVERHREARRGVVVVQIPSSGGVMSVGAGYGMAQIWRKIGVVVALFKGAYC